MLITVILLLCTSWATFAAAPDNPSESGLFSGRISKIQEKAGLIRLRIDFANMKYLNKKDSLEFWDERGIGRKCRAYVAGKSNYYLLLKVQNYKVCKYDVFLTQGAYVKVYSKDLENNIKMGKELVDVLLKKRLAVFSKFSRSKKELDAHIEKVNAVNMRYQTLREKLEVQWRSELADLENDRAATYKNYKEVESKLFSVDHKLEKYRVEDQNLKTDRWALDSNLYFKK
jgi:hypothetical protein